MMPVAIALILGAVLLGGALAAALVVRSTRSRRSSSNLVDLAAARRRKLRTAPAKSAETEPVKPKRAAASSSRGADIRGFVPKNGDGRQQPCSYCQKKSDSIAFYVDDYGKLVGVCKECRKSAKNRDLMPL